jgi:hypothetical protein
MTLPEAPAVQLGRPAYWTKVRLRAPMRVMHHLARIGKYSRVGRREMPSPRICKEYRCSGLAPRPFSATGQRAHRHRLKEERNG